MREQRTFRGRFGDGATVDLGLAGRTYIVTGGTKGLGFAAASVLVEEGANVVVSSRDVHNVDEAVARLGAAPSSKGARRGGVTGVAADLGDAAAPPLLAEVAREHFGDLHGAFISHGGPPPAPALELTESKLEQAIAVSLVGPIRFLRDVAPTLPPGGAIVVLTSSSSVEPHHGLAGSNLTRPGVHGYAKTLADELGPRGVRINVLLPGRFDTDRSRSNDEARAAREGKSFEEIRDASMRDIPLRRVGDPLELGRVAAFLLSPAASYVTGVAWLVDGGRVRGL